MSEPVRGSRHKGISPDLVVRAATDLTRERGITGWSVRDLAGRLGVAPPSIYHHVGDRAEVIRQVVRGLVAGVDRPDPDLDWRDWFEQFLLGIRGALIAYPGVAHWFMMHGPSMRTATDIVDAGIATLERAGFGDRAGYAYTLLFNQAVGTIALSQDRRAAHSADGDRDLSAMLADFTRLAPSSHGVAVLTESVLLPLINDPDVEEAYYRQALRTTMRGLAAELDERGGEGGPS